MIFIYEDFNFADELVEAIVFTIFPECSYQKWLHLVTFPSCLYEIQFRQATRESKTSIKKRNFSQKFSEWVDVITVSNGTRPQLQHKICADSVWFQIKMEIIRHQSGFSISNHANFGDFRILVCRGRLRMHNQTCIERSPMENGGMTAYYRLTLNTGSTDQGYCK